MWKERLYLVVCLILTICCVSADPISFIKKCTATDSKCIKESAQAALPSYAVGVPELGIESLDPLFISKVDASRKGLNLILTDVKVTGLKGCRIKKLTRDLEKSKLIAKVQCDVNLDGQYEMSGRLLVLPIEGQGPFHAKLRKIVINADIDVEEKTGKEDKKYWNLKSWNHSYELKDKADIVFENLFSGNDVLGRAARELVASSGNDIIIEVGPPVLKTIISNLVNNVNHFFHKTPVEDLVLEN